MSQHREYLLATLRHIIAGGDLSQSDLDAAVAEPRLLRGPELKAWYGLSYWADDDDIRARKPEYGPMRREGLARLLAALEQEN